MKLGDLSELKMSDEDIVILLSNLLNNAIEASENTEEKIVKFAEDRDWLQFNTPENLAKSISIEAGELLECFQWNENYDLNKVKEELADVIVTMKTKAHITGVDIQESICDYARRSVELNNFQNQIDIVNADIKDVYKIVGTNHFDIVTCNPPYFKYLETSNINKNDYLTIARHEVKINLEEIISEAKKLLNEGGSLYMVHRVERFSEIIYLLNKYRFEAKRIRFMYPKVNSDEALLVLIEAKNNAKPGVKILQPFYMYDENGEYTKEALDMFNYKPR